MWARGFTISWGQHLPMIFTQLPFEEHSDLAALDAFSLKPSAVFG